MAELDRVGSLATLDQLSLRLEQAEELLVVLDRFAVEYATPRHVANLDRHGRQIVEFVPKRVRFALLNAWSDRDPRGIEQIERSRENPVGQLQQRPVSILQPGLVVASLFGGDPID